MKNQDPIISLKNISFTVNGKKILDSISFEIFPEETFVLLGKNGSGKTVLLKIIMSLLKHTSGEAFVFGKNFSKLKESELVDYLKKIGYVFQQSGLFDSMNIAENVLFGLNRYKILNKEEAMKKATACLNKTNLYNVEKLYPSELSGGMRKRASMARAIIMEPELLIMDDPAAGLDPVLTDSMANLILDIRSNLKSTFILTTHDLKFATKLADKIGLIIDGKLHGVVTADDFWKTKDESFVQFREGSLVGPIAIL